MGDSDLFAVPRARGEEEGLSSHHDYYLLTNPPLRPSSLQKLNLHHCVHGSRRLNRYVLLLPHIQPSSAWAQPKMLSDACATLSPARQTTAMRKSRRPRNGDDKWAGNRQLGLCIGRWGSQHDWRLTARATEPECSRCKQPKPTDSRPAHPASAPAAQCASMQAFKQPPLSALTNQHTNAINSAGPQPPENCRSGMKECMRHRGVTYKLGSICHVCKSAKSVLRDQPTHKSVGAMANGGLAGLSSSDMPGLPSDWCVSPGMLDELSPPFTIASPRDSAQECLLDHELTQRVVASAKAQQAQQTAAPAVPKPVPNEPAVPSRRRRSRRADAGAGWANQMELGLCVGRWGSEHDWRLSARATQPECSRCKQLKPLDAEEPAAADTARQREPAAESLRHERAEQVKERRTEQQRRRREQRKRPREEDSRPSSPMEVADTPVKMEIPAVGCERCASNCCIQPLQLSKQSIVLCLCGVWC